MLAKNIVYTACTLKLRPVKLLFVIFGRLSYSFFVILMVSGNGRLSYFLLKTDIYFLKLEQNEKLVQNGLQKDHFYVA